MSVRLISNFAQVEGRIEKATRDRVLRACHAVRNEWVEGLSGTRSGRLYRLPQSKTQFSARRYRAARRKGKTLSGWYRASAPGEAPARRLGDHIRSIRVQPRIEPGKAQARVGSPLETFIYLEYGTENEEPRPSLKPALDRVRPKLNAIFSEGLI